MVSAGGMSAIGPRMPADPIGDPPINVSLVALTNDQGYYELTVPAGKWLVTANAALFKPQWYNLKDDPKNADPVVVAADATVADVNFALAAQPHATITGTVTKADGSPLAKAMVMAVNRAPQPQNPPPGGSPTLGTAGPVTFTDDNGHYTLVVPPGIFAIGAGAGDNRSPQIGARVRPSLWWDNHDKLEDADLLTLADGDTHDGINFQLK
jgi:hypothetical protein